MKRFLASSRAVSTGPGFVHRLRCCFGCANATAGALLVATVAASHLILLPLSLVYPATTVAADDLVSGDNLYLRERGKAIALTQTSLRLPALTNIPLTVQSTTESGATAAEPLRSVRPVIDSEGLAVVELYARSDGDVPELICHSFVQSGDSSGPAQLVTLTATQRPQQWHGSCRVLPGTVVILVQMTKQTQANAVYGLAIGDAEQVLHNLLKFADMDIVDLLQIAKIAVRAYPQNDFAGTVFNSLFPVRHHVVNRAKHKLLGRSPDQIRKQEKHSFDLAMRNGVDGRGYRLQDYLRDYPGGRFSVKARLEIPKRKRVLFESLPRWAERRAENVLRIVLLWQDSYQKVDALQKYILAYPHGRFVPIVRSEIGRIRDVAEADVLAAQMTAGSMR